MSNGGKRSSTSTTFHLIAGLGSGFTSAILLQPADLLKTRLQQPGSISLLYTIRDIASKPAPFRQLWRGTLPSTIRTSLGSALYFTSLNAFRTNLARSTRFTSIKPNNAAPSTKTGSSSSSLPTLSPLGNLLSGSVARATVGFIMMPFTVLKVRYESNLYAYNSLYGAAKDISVREGLRGFFAGFGATALRDAPYAGLYVVFYEGGKRYLSGLVDTGATARYATENHAGINTGTTIGGDASMRAADISASFPAAAAGPARIPATTSAVINFASSTLAASTATAITNPPDAIKTRLQLQPQKYRNTLQAAKLMLKEEGVRSLFDGLALRMARKAMSSALAWTVYEEVIRRAERRWDTID